MTVEGNLPNANQYGGYPQANVPAVPAVPMYPARMPSPTVAALLGFIPGAGALYNGQFTKALIHVLAFASFIWLAAEGYGLFGGLMIAFSVLYMVADAYKTAEARQYGLPVPDPFGLASLFGETHVRAGAVVADPKRSFPAGAVILIAIGGLFLLRTLSVWRPDFDRFWPVILIVIGAVLLVCRIPWKKSSE
jgi:TM2 domain-containing membrane protein YozV